MTRKKKRKVGVEAITEPGVGSLYVRTSWMKKLGEVDKRKKRPKTFRKRK